jgi:hypothetical protein
MASVQGQAGRRRRGLRTHVELDGDHPLGDEQRATKSMIEAACSRVDPVLTRLIASFWNML